MPLSARTIRTWSWLHKWSSLACTVFMLLLCLTGLPLIFHDEIGEWVGTRVTPPPMPGVTRRIPLDEALGVARRVYPDRFVQFASQDDGSDEAWFVTMTPTPAPTADFRQVVVDARTGGVLPSAGIDQGFMWLMERLHVDLFAGLAGKLFLGSMGLLLLVSIVSGVVLYAPFMRKLPFGAVRKDRSRRVLWLDLHNLLGIASLAWALVVGATGVANTLIDLAQDYWREHELQPLLAKYQGDTPVPVPDWAPVQRALEAARSRVPGTSVSFIAFPGTSFATPHHFAFYLHGSTPLTGRLREAVLVDARTAEVSAVPQRPWYLTALQLSQPLHFGDYAGWPMKILWTLLDLVTIVVLASGLYLWLRRREPRPAPDGSALAFTEASP
ncbi:PepSY-associated TM helix domain-containing protein [Ramlibacter monticola]